MKKNANPPKSQQDVKGNKASNAYMESYKTKMYYQQYYTLERIASSLALDLPSLRDKLKCYPKIEEKIAILESMIIGTSATTVSALSRANKEIKRLHGRLQYVSQMSFDFIINKD